MKFNSSIYKCSVMHNRLSPKKHAFWYSIYMFYLDLDEIDLLEEKLLLFSRNKFNLFSFTDKEHFINLNNLNLTTKQNIINYLNTQNVKANNFKIMLLTNLNVLGYNFNPVSFYFCFNSDGIPECAVAEISNTFREMKLFIFNKSDLYVDAFKKITQKMFYVSPFVDLDAYFEFNLQIPNNKLNIKIDDLDHQNNKFFLSTLTGKKEELKNSKLIKYFLSMPLIPLQIMGLIHWQAFKLWLKKLPFHKKMENQALQQNVHNKYKKHH